MMIYHNTRNTNRAASAHWAAYLLLLLTCGASPLQAEETRAACFPDLASEVKDIPWSQGDATNEKLSRNDIHELQQKWYRLSRQKNHKSLYELTTPNFRVIRTRPGGGREVDIREEYFLDLALWFARGGVLVSTKRENESIRFSKNGNWAVYEADIWQTSRTGSSLVKAKFREKSYITLYKGHARYAAFCARFRKLVQVPTQECGKSI